MPPLENVPRGNFPSPFSCSRNLPMLPIGAAGVIGTRAPSHGDARKIAAAGESRGCRGRSRRQRENSAAQNLEIC